MNEPQAATRTQLITSLLPADVAVYYSAELPAETQLLPEETGATENMVAARRDEFVHGRHCAREAMQALGQDAAAILKHEDRSPIWPAGITGTISHFGNHAAAAVARAESYLGLGLDLESPEALTADIATLVCRPNEVDEAVDAKLLFSIKEAIYKCIYPTVGHYVDFQEMEVRLSSETQSYTALPHSKALDADLISGLRGKFHRDEEMVVASAWLAC